MFSNLPSQESFDANGCFQQAPSPLQVDSGLACLRRAKTLVAGMASNLLREGHSTSDAECKTRDPQKDPIQFENK